jgi:tight adherence protein C
MIGRVVIAGSALPIEDVSWLPAAICSWPAAVVLAVARIRIPARAARLAASAPTSGASRLPARSAVLVVGALMAAVVLHPSVGVATLMGPPVVARWHARRRARLDAARVAAAVPELVDLVTAGIAAGCTARDALVSCLGVAPAPLRPALARLATRLARGARFADALQQLAHDVGEASRPFVSALRAHERDGVPLRPTLERIATDARRQRRQAAEAAIRRLPVRLSVPLVTCTLSAFVVLTVVPLGAATVRSLQRDMPAVAPAPLPVIAPLEVPP